MKVNEKAQFSLVAKRLPRIDAAKLARRIGLDGAVSIKKGIARCWVKYSRFARASVTAGSALG